MRWIIQALILCTYLGCTSNTEKMSEGANEISRLAHSSGERFEIISQASIPPELVESAEKGHKEQDEIVLLTEEIQINLQGVVDRVPWWAVLFQKLAVVVAIVGIAFILWQTGLGYILKRIFWGIGWFIPSSVKREVELDMKNLDTENQASLRESIAARRASSPAYNEAWKLKRRSV
jgi:hypothetical protein